MASTNTTSVLNEKNLKDFKFHVKGNNGNTVWERANCFAQFLKHVNESGSTYSRLILSPIDRDVIIKDPFNEGLIL